MTYPGEPDMPRRRKPPVPTLPRPVVARLRGRVVAGCLADERGIVPGSAALRCDPAGLSGPDRERVAADIVRLAGLDPKTDHDAIYDLFFPKAG